MKTKHEYWTIEKLLENIGIIEFPEFQREPTVWKLDKKQRLIDSILRDFDISSIYFYKRDDSGYDCIDGRQRINAILSYLGENGSDEDDNGFNLVIENEIYDDRNYLKDADKIRFKKLSEKYKSKIYNYNLNIVIITDVSNEEELNLLFLRLQIASVLNAGEKLNAMTGAMRDTIFYTIAKHNYFAKIKIPPRRFAKEQVAAQIVLNDFRKRESNMFSRSRYIDLQSFFKQYNKLSLEGKNSIEKIKSNMDIIVNHFNDDLKILHNRALTVSLYLFISEMIDNNTEDEIDDFVDFFKLFMKTLKWQVPKGVEMDKEYHNLLNFQTNITQAAGERTAIQKRHDFLREYFYYYKINKTIKGDDEYSKRTNKNPSDERKKVKL